MTDLVGSTSDITLNEEDIIAVGDDTSITIITQADFYEEIEREIELILEQPVIFDETRIPTGNVVELSEEDLDEMTQEQI